MRCVEGRLQASGAHPQVSRLAAKLTSCLGYCYRLLPLPHAVPDGVLLAAVELDSPLWSSPAPSAGDEARCWPSNGEMRGSSPYCACVPSPPQLRWVPLLSRGAGEDDRPRGRDACWSSQLRRYHLERLACEEALPGSPRATLFLPRGANGLPHTAYRISKRLFRNAASAFLPLRITDLPFWQRHLQFCHIRPSRAGYD